MKILKPLEITDSVLTFSNLAEDATPAWVSGGSYVVGDEVHLVSTHRVYRCAVNTTGTTPPNQAITVWSDIRPTNKWAAFDTYTSTKTTNGSSQIYYTFAPNDIVNALTLFNVTGMKVTFTVFVNESPVTYTVDLWQPEGWYEYFFSTPTYHARSVVIENLPNGYTNPTLTIFAQSGYTTSVGMIAMGDMRDIAPTELGSSADEGSSAEPVTYSYIRTEEDGTTTIKRRHSATNLRLSATIPIEQADYALSTIQEVLDIPVAVIGTDAYTAKGLSTFGLVSGTVDYRSNIANVSINVKGLI